MEIELPPGLRIGRRIREVQVDANGRPLFFLLCFPCLDRHCCCNVAGSAHQLTLFRALGSALFEIRVAVTRPPFCERREEQEGQKCEGEAERETWCWTRVRLSCNCLYNTTLSRLSSSSSSCLEQAFLLFNLLKHPPSNHLELNFCSMSN